jgi:hypothetical protein
VVGSPPWFRDRVPHLTGEPFRVTQHDDVDVIVREPMEQHVDARVITAVAPRMIIPVSSRTFSTVYPRRTTCEASRRGSFRCTAVSTTAGSLGGPQDVVGHGRGDSSIWMGELPRFD